MDNILLLLLATAIVGVFVVFCLRIITDSNASNKRYEQETKEIIARLKARRDGN